MTERVLVDTNVLVYSRDASEPPKTKTSHGLGWPVYGTWHLQDRYRLSWWGSPVVSAAQIGDCRYLLTEDLQENQNLGNIKIINPLTGTCTDWR